jgi:hypothetical protein
MGRDRPLDLNRAGAPSRFWPIRITGNSYLRQSAAACVEKMTPNEKMKMGTICQAAMPVLGSTQFVIP